MALTSLGQALHQAPVITINGYEIDEDSWRFHPNGIYCSSGDDHCWFFPNQAVEIYNDGHCIARDADGAEVSIRLQKLVPFTDEDIT